MPEANPETFGEAESDTRPDLLAYLDRYDRRPHRVVRRIERWRRREWKRGEIAARARRVAGELAARQVESGDRVGLWLNDGPLWHAAFLGALRAGAVAVPLDVSLGPEVVRDRSDELELVAWCTEREVPDLGLDLPRLLLEWESDESGALALPSLPDPDPDRTAEIVLTSGTSGAPKAVPVSHGNLRSVLDALEEGVEEYRLALRLTPPMRLAVALPLSHLYGQVMGVFVPALVGADVALLATMPAPDLARRLREERAWVLATVPRTIELLGRHLRARGEARWGAEGFSERLEAARERSWWRRWGTFAPLRRELGFRFLAVVSGGAALDPDVEAFWRTLGYAVVQGYGLTETAPLVTLNHPFDTSPGSLGRPLPGVEIEIADDGEILVRGPNVVPARFGGPAVDEEGWLHTGDLGELDPAGRLRYRGRKGERIVTPAGVNVDPEPVADALRGRDDVLDAVVLERPWGESGVVTAVLAMRPGGVPEAAVRAANEKLPDAARVRDWHVWPKTDFPRTPTGKPRRPEILAWLGERAPEAETEERTAAEEAGPPLEKPADARSVVAGAIAEQAGTSRSDIEPEDRLADLLGSLDRVELATRLETTFGVTLTAGTFAEDRTVEDLAEALLDAVGRADGPDRTGETRDVPPRRTAEPEELEERAPPTEGAAEEPAEGGAVRTASRRRARVPRARWRDRSPTRLLRLAIREGVIHPLWRSFVDLDVSGTESVDDVAPPFVVAANHLSIFDPGTVLFGLPRRHRGRIATTAMWEFFEEARLGPFWYRLGVLGLNLVPLVQRGDWRPTLEIAGAVVDRGGCPLVFPEGERSTDGELLEFRRGVAVLARDLHLPIVPCAISGLLEVLPRGAHWPRNFWTSRARVEIRFGEPIPAPRPQADPDEIVSVLKEQVAGLLEESRGSAAHSRAEEEPR